MDGCFNLLSSILVNFMKLESCLLCFLLEGNDWPLLWQSLEIITTAWLGLAVPQVVLLMIVLIFTTFNWSRECFINWNLFLMQLVARLFFPYSKIVFIMIVWLTHIISMIYFKSCFIFVFNQFGYSSKDKIILNLISVFVF